MSAPTRRSLLRASGSVLAGGFLVGCTGIASDSGGTTTGRTPTATGTETAASGRSTRSPSDTDNPSRTISLANLDDSRLPDEDDLSVAVAIVEPSVTDDHTARIRATFTNDGSKRTFGGFGRFMPLDLQRAGQSSDAGLILIPRRLLASERDSSPDAYLTPTPANGCWSATFSPSMGPDRTFTLDAGETVTQTLEVWDDSDAEGCMPPGIYQFTGSYSLGESKSACEVGGATDCDTAATEREWTFMLSVNSAGQ